MNSSIYDVKEYLQPTNHSCCQTALAILLSHYNVDLQPEEIIAKSPVAKDEDGKDFGTMVQQLATWSIGLGFNVTMVSADFQILDLSWSSLSGEQIAERLEAVQENRNVGALGKHFSKMYVKGYLEFLRAGGKLVVKSWIGLQAILALLEKGPIHISVGSNTYFEHGRSFCPSLRETQVDDINGETQTHSVVVFGTDDNGNFLAKDPWKAGTRAINKEHLVATLSAASFMADNILFQLEPKQHH